MATLGLIVFGSGGLLGRYCVEYFSAQPGTKVAALTRNHFDIRSADPAKLDQTLRQALLTLGKKVVVVNCAADLTREGKETAAHEGASLHDQFVVNAWFPGALWRAARKLGVGMVHISTDGVFSGRDAPPSFSGHLESDPATEMQDRYCVSKHLADISFDEPAPCIIRTSIVGEGKGLLQSMLDRAAGGASGGQPVSGFDNQLWNGVTCLQLAKVIYGLAERNLLWSGLRHVFSPAAVSRFELMQLIDATYALGCQIQKAQALKPVDRRLATAFKLPIDIPPIAQQLLDLRSFHIPRQKSLAFTAAAVRTAGMGSPVVVGKPRDQSEMYERIEGERVLVVGGSGSLGNHLIRLMTNYNLRATTKKKIRLMVVSRDENKQWIMKKLFPDVDFYLGDMRDQTRMREVLETARPSIIIVAAALKHIDVCEHQVGECLETNVIGVQRLARAIVAYSQARAVAGVLQANRLKTVVFVSTDKACSPVNVYGMSKALSERVVNENGVRYAGEPDLMPKFLCVRYGNVLNSRGSIIPKFSELAADKNSTCFPVTDVRMTRFFMTLDESACLILSAIVYGKPGETWIPNVPAVSILALAEYFSARFKKPVKIVGLRPGEKIHECLINETEIARTERRVVPGRRETFFVIRPPLEIATTTCTDLKAELTSAAIVPFNALRPILEEIVDVPKPEPVDLALDPPAGVAVIHAKCRFCGAAGDRLVRFLDLGAMPHAGGFLLRPDQREVAYPLSVHFCTSCALVQVLDVIEKETLFTDYFYLSSVSQTMIKHAQEYAATLKPLVRAEGLVVEIGCNDGILLDPLKVLNVRAVGVDPAANVAKLAVAKGHEVMIGFFNEQIAKEIRGTYGAADVITGSNVLAHIDDMDQIMRGVNVLLRAGGGTLVFEVHYLVNLLREFQYDMIYNEHLCYYSLTALQPFLTRHGLTLFDAQRVPIHAGSIRVFASNVESTPATERLRDLLKLEKELKVDRLETYAEYGKRVEAHRAEFVALLKKLKADGKKVAGYGASGRANTVLNYCGVDPTLVQYIVDDSPRRQNTWTPGMHIPVVAPAKLLAAPPDYIVLFAWSYAEEITAKLRNTYKGRFIIPLPTIQIK